MPSPATKAAPKSAPAPKAAVKAAPKAVAAPVPKTAAKPQATSAAPVAVKPVTAKAATVPVPPAPAATPVPSVAPNAAPRKSSRAAKAAAMVPPPPAPVVASTAAKASYGPAKAPPPSVVPVIPKKDAKLANNWKTKPLEQLVDADVMAMPDAEYMNDVQMAFFRRKLEQLKQDILNNAGETTEHLREDTVIVPDPADRATIEEEHALELRTRDRERKLLKKIEQSIQRIDAGDYGYCDETGEPIGVGRLLARPTATLSLEAQQRRELKQKMFGD
ncbi:MAG: RNA polymerase-binding protein DksA [Limnohabitans sp.]|nr:RNA polymerase-binding protein DksA [Limnohabitans sp.]